MSVIERERVDAPVVTEADVLERAAYGYEEGLYDWCQGYIGGAGVRCMAGAIFEAADALGRVKDKEWWKAMASALEAVGFDCYRDGPEFVRWDVPDWNDTPGRTKAEVVAKLREAAREARA